MLTQLGLLRSTHVAYLCPPLLLPPIAQIPSLRSVCDMARQAQQYSWLEHWWGNNRNLLTESVSESLFRKMRTFQHAD
jgi:hypothetical protein